MSKNKIYILLILLAIVGGIISGITTLSTSRSPLVFEKKTEGAAIFKEYLNNNDIDVVINYYDARWDPERQLGPPMTGSLNSKNKIYLLSVLSSLNYYRIRDEYTLQFFRISGSKTVVSITGHFSPPKELRFLTAEVVEVRNGNESIEYYAVDYDERISGMIAFGRGEIHE